MYALNHQDLAKLHTKLIVPVVIGDILDQSMDIEADIQYGLHEVLSEMDPDAALLAIACSAVQLSSKFPKELLLAGALRLEAEKMIGEYGPTWFQHADKGYSEYTPDTLNMVMHLPEDLESIADLLDTLKLSVLSDPDSLLFVLCDILSLQARVHMDIADVLLEEAESISDNGLQVTETKSHHNAQTQSASKHNNIIMFPGSSKH